MKIDPRLFVISYSLLTYTRSSAMNTFSIALRDSINYIAAQKRIKVVTTQCY